MQPQRRRRRRRPDDDDDAAPRVVRETVRVLNGTSITLQCEPAEFVVRTYMAPKYEEPRLVRRLDWFQDGSLVASFQQVGKPRASRSQRRRLYAQSRASSSREKIHARARALQVEFHSVAAAAAIVVVVVTPRRRFFVHARARSLACGRESRRPLEVARVSGEKLAIAARANGERRAARRRSSGTLKTAPQCKIVGAAAAAF